MFSSLLFNLSKLTGFVEGSVETFRISKYAAYSLSLITAPVGGKTYMLVYLKLSEIYSRHHKIFRLLSEVNSIFFVHVIYHRL